MEKKFIADNMLGKMVKWLRIAGIDVAYDGNYTRRGLVEAARLEDRMILTRSRKVKYPELLIIKSEWFDAQLEQFFSCFGHLGEGCFFTRCLICNTILEPAEKESIRNKVPPRVYLIQDSFNRCPGCERIYWKGSHYKRMLKQITDILKKYK